MAKETLPLSRPLSRPPLSVFLLLAKQASNNWTSDNNALRCNFASCGVPPLLSTDVRRRDNGRQTDFDKYASRATYDSGNNTARHRRWRRTLLAKWNRCPSRPVTCAVPLSLSLSAWCHTSKKWSRATCCQRDRRVSTEGRGRKKHLRLSRPHRPCGKECEREKPRHALHAAVGSSPEPRGDALPSPNGKSRVAGRVPNNIVKTMHSSQFVHFILAQRPC